MTKRSATIPWSSGKKPDSKRVTRGLGAGRGVSEPLPANLVEVLCHRASYPEDPSALGPVEHVQTHLGHVFLTADRAYKLRKAVSFGFVDFGSRGSRCRDCREEVHLNRRLAPDVYLGVAPVRATRDGFRVGAIQEPSFCDAHSAGCEWVTVMRRLPPGRDALSLSRANALTHDQIAIAAERIARFHDDYRLPRAVLPDCADRHSGEALRATIEALRPALSDEEMGLLNRVDWATREFEFYHGYRLKRRLRAGRWVDGHGDLHLQHLWFEDANTLNVIDCLEFDRALRQIDAACDVAFLTMDLRYRRRGDLAEAFLNRYAEISDDYDLFSVLRYFECYRALVRAKVAGLAVRDSTIPAFQREQARESCSHHLALADRLLHRSQPGDLVIMSGSIGTGKSTAARELAERLSALRIRSDGVRKHLSGVSPTTSLASAPDAAHYAPEARARVYLALQERARPALRSGRPVVLDASYGSARERTALREWARAHGFRVWLVETVCSPDEARARLGARERAGRDPSDAGPELLEASRAHYEVPDEWPEAERVRIDTEAKDWELDIATFAARVQTGRFG